MNYYAIRTLLKFVVLLVCISCLKGILIIGSYQTKSTTCKIKWYHSSTPHDYENINTEALVCNSFTKYSAPTCADREGWDYHTNCESFQCETFVTIMRNKRVLLLGDSLMEQQYNNLRCLCSNYFDGDDATDCHLQYGSHCPTGWRHTTKLKNNVTISEILIKENGFPKKLDKDLNYDVILFNIGAHLDENEMNRSLDNMYKQIPKGSFLIGRQYSPTHFWSPNGSDFEDVINSLGM